jgi:hypothetical protein
MNTPTPTPRTDTEITLTGAYTCTHHNDAERTACPVCLVTALTAERDQLRAALALGQINCDNAYDDLRTERDQLRAEVERLKKQAVFDADHVHALNSAFATRAELTTEREKVRTLREALENLRDEQNGVPLYTREEQWKQAMDGAQAALAATEEIK